MKAGMFLLILYFLLISPFFPSDSADAQQGVPPVEVSVYLTEEKKACAPNGYSDKLHTRKRNCNPLIYEKLESYEFGEPIYARVPPECLPLGELAERIREATQDCPIDKYCTDPELRKAIVLVFYFGIDNPKDRSVEFIREIPTRLEKHFLEDEAKGTYVAEGTLDQGGHWINHQRADLFLPDYGVRWILDVDGNIYTIGTKKGTKVNETGEWKCNEEN
jgi:hypothetical protein